MFASVIIPSFQRANFLSKCLQSVLCQEKPNDMDYEVIVVIRQGDSDTESVVREFAGHRLISVYVDVPGVIQAMKAGVGASKGEIILFIDDDAEAPRSWLLDHCSHYADGNGYVSCVAGRDVLDTAIAEQKFSFGKVGRVTRYGRLIGDHCQPERLKQEIDIPKGVNMSVTRKDLELPVDMSGQGAQIHWEVYLGLALRAGGHKVVYDPDIVVYHHVAPRPSGDHRTDVSIQSVFDAGYNFSYAFSKFSSWADCLLAVIYWLLFGDAAAPGVFRCLFRNRTNWVRWTVAMKGRLCGVRRGLMERRHV